jgi:hypothetical protein
MNLIANSLRPLHPINFGLSLLDLVRVANADSRLLPKLKLTSV